MLTGILASDASSGNTAIYGHNLKTDLPAVRRQLGLCPQHDVLFDLLTTREHLVFFSLLKGGSTVFAEAEEEADGLLHEFHLQDRASHVGTELSGGMRRKLSTAIAVCGKSKLIILDEPSAGVD